MYLSTNTFNRVYKPGPNLQFCSLSDSCRVVASLGELVRCDVTLHILLRHGLTRNLKRKMSNCDLTINRCSVGENCPPAKVYSGCLPPSNSRRKGLNATKSLISVLNIVPFLLCFTTQNHAVANVSVPFKIKTSFEMTRQFQCSFSGPLIHNTFSSQN